MAESIKTKSDVIVYAERLKHIDEKITKERNAIDTHLDERDKHQSCIDEGNKVINELDEERLGIEKGLFNYFNNYWIEE